jgi:hypothetical protein
MPAKRTLERARQAAREGKAPSTQAGDFVREEIEHIREGKHGARSTKQAIAIGLSKARAVGVPLRPPQRARSRKRPVAARSKPIDGVSAVEALAHCRVAREPRLALCSVKDGPLRHRRRSRDKLGGQPRPGGGSVHKALIEPAGSTGSGTSRLAVSPRGQ